jgi:hypothetical protein
MSSSKISGSVVLLPLFPVSTDFFIGLLDILLSQKESGTRFLNERHSLGYIQQEDFDLSLA